MSAPAGLRIERILAPDERLAALTYPRFRPALSGNGDAGLLARQLAVGAWLHGAPVGLAYLSEPHRVPGHAPCEVRQLLSVMVQPLLRRLGIGRVLLAHAEKLAAAEGCRLLEALYAGDLQARAGFEALLRSAGWSAPELHECRIVARCRWVAESRDDWAPRMARWRDRGFSADAWSTLRDSDIAEIAHAVANELPEADRAFDPVETVRTTGAQEASLLLRRHGRIAGWIVGVPGAPAQSVYYGHGYALPEVQPLGWLVAGMREVCERQLARLGPDSLCMFATAGSNRAMRRVLQRQFARYADRTDERYRSTKRLAESC